MTCRAAAVVLLLVSIFSPTAVSAETVSEKATVVLFRESRVVARVYRSPIYLNDEPLLDLTNGSVWKGMFAPGRYTLSARDKDVFSAKDKNASSVELDLQPGQTVYVRAELAMGARKPNTKLTVVAEQKAAEEAARLKTLKRGNVKHPRYKAAD